MLELRRPCRLILWLSRQGCSTLEPIEKPLAELSRRGGINKVLETANLVTLN